MGFIDREDLVPKRLAGGIECADHEIGLLFGAQIDQIASKAKEGIGRQPGRAAHLRNGVKYLKDQRMRIDQIYASVRGAHCIDLKKKNRQEKVRKGSRCCAAVYTG